LIFKEKFWRFGAWVAPGPGSGLKPAKAEAIREFIDSLEVLSIKGYNKRI
jgi:hypothetical protein